MATHLTTPWPIAPKGISRRRFVQTAVVGTLAYTLSRQTGLGLLKGSDAQAIPRSLISIDPARGYFRYNRMLFGQFLEHFHRQVYGGIFEPGSNLSDAVGFRTDVIEALRELRVPIVRWPGGCFVSAYHWLDGVGPNRKPSYDKAWLVSDSNKFGTDEFVTWCRKIGAEPYICTNAGTGTAEEMANWVEYCNLSGGGKFADLRRENGHSEPLRVRFWSVGNENYGDWEIGAKTAEEWGHLVAESAKMMRRIDPSIKLSAAALPRLEWPPLQPTWTLPLLRVAGGYLDYVSIHGYWDSLYQQNNPSDYRTCMIRSIEPEKDIRFTEELLAVAGFDGKIGIAFDEWNLRGWHVPLGNSPEAIAARDKNDINSTYTLADAVFSAGFLNACLRHAKTVQMANMSPVVNVRGPLFVHSKGIVKRTSFHVLKMYSDLLASNVVDAFVGSDPFTHEGKTVPVFDAAITCNDDWKNLSLAMVNRHPDKEVLCSVRIGGIPVEGTFPATMLTGDSPDAYNDVVQPNRVTPTKGSLRFSKGAASVPPHSVVLCQIEWPHREP
jgi:alpha-L-arabinofuranosidase